MIEIDNLSKSYGRTEAIRGISFRVKKGEILGLLGPNGAGKTTTMRILTCFMPPTSGRAVIAGVDCSENPLEVKKRMGYLPESAPLYGEMKTIEYLDFAARVKGLDRSARTSRIPLMMEKTGISDVSERLIGKLSRGYRQRVGIAQAMLNDPEILILDEPTAGLDPRQIVEIRALIRELAGERTVILSTHILPEVSLVCDRVVIMSKGKVVAEDTPKNLAMQRESRGTIRILAEGDPAAITRLLMSIRGVRGVSADAAKEGGNTSLFVETDPATDPRKEIAAAVVSHGFGLLEISRKPATLEEVFVELVTEEKEEGPPNG